MCDRHNPVPCRELHFEKKQDCEIPGHWHLVVGRDGTPKPIDHTDGFGCPACGEFTPNEAPVAR